MKLSAVFAGLLLSSAVVAEIDLNKWLARSQRVHDVPSYSTERRVVKRDAQGSIFNTANTSKFAVDGKTIPEVPFDVGESYSGLLPVGEGDGNMFFWFWPTTAPGQPKEILLWLNGGPGCSSMDGLLKEHGPFLWPSGSIETVPNPWSWHHITNVVYVEQPLGTGFSDGNVTAKNEEDVARQFMGFWRNLIDTFGMQGYKVYIAGESYAGMYCSYISSAMLDANDTKYFDVKGMHLIDPVIGDHAYDTTIHDFVDFWRPVFPFNESTQARLNEMHERCGFKAYFDKYMVFPPAGQQPVDPPRGNDTNDCTIADAVVSAVLEINPGFDVYQVSAIAPISYDPLGFPTVFLYMPPGQQVYFNRTDVKKAIHAPLDVNWQVCTNRSVFAGNKDLSDSPISKVLPHVIERTNNVIITHGQNDMILTASGSLLAIQNMTWNQAMGFQCRPSEPLFVPIHDIGDDFNNLNGSGPITFSARGITGTTHTERGLTFCNVVAAGHMVPTNQPSTVFRLTEFLLGRVPNLQSTVPLSNYPGVPQPDPKTFGSGTARSIGQGPACSVKSS